ncbi:MAG: hypothetical protein ACC662_09105, partial [Planctomycetota bacterium]
MLLLIPTAAEAAGLLDGPVPQDEHPVATTLAGRSVRAALCGFGPFAAGVLASRALEAAPGETGVLVGIAGTLAPERVAVGEVLWADAVLSAGVGRGRGPAFQGPRALGLPQAPAGAGGAGVWGGIEVGGAPMLGAPGPGLVRGALLTVSAASGTPEEAGERARAHPDALAEDMEGFSVALAAR